MRKKEIAALVLAAGTGAMLLAASRNAAEEKPPARTSIAHVRLFDGNRTINDATVTFDRSGILSICTSCEPPKDARVIDGRGKTLLPGLIDSHTHVFGEALQRALVFGVTTEIDMFTSHELAAAWRREQKSGGATQRADIFSAGTLVTVEGGHGTEYFMKIPTYAKGADAQKFIDDRIAEGSDFIKLVYDDGSTFARHFNTLDEESLRTLIAAAKKRDKLAVVHVSSAKGAVIAVRAGADGLVHGWGTEIGSDELFKEIRKRKVFVIPTLSILGSIAGRTEGAVLAAHPALQRYIAANEIDALKSRFPSREEWKSTLDTGRSVTKRIHADGGVILAGTDAPNPGTAHGLSLHRELELLVESGLTPVEALRAATSVPAKTFRLSDRGVVAKGKRADLLLVDGDPTTDVTATRNIMSVFKEGSEFIRPDAALQQKLEVKKLEIPDGLLSDFEKGLRSATGTDWFISTDAMAGGKSTAAVELIAAGPAGSKVLHVTGNIRPGHAFPWAGAMLMFGTPMMTPVDVRPMKELTFSIRNEKPMRLLVFARSAGQFPRNREIPASKEWQTLTFSFESLGVSGADMQAILITGLDETFAYDLDDVKLK